MGITTTSTYVCDKDGATASGTGMPEGWITIRVEGATVEGGMDDEGMPVPPADNMGSYLLCPACATPVSELMTSMKKTGDST